MIEPVDRLIFDGQSLNRQPANAMYPDLLAADLTVPAEYFNRAVGGTSYATRAANADTRVDPLAGVAGRRNILIDLAGQNDLALQGSPLTAEELYPDVVAYHEARKAAGFDLTVICTVPPAVSFVGAEETERQAYNAMLRASEDFDLVIDLEADPRLADYTDTTYYSDGLHFTAAGAQACADVVLAALAALDVT